jgi:hypothetical protein
MSKRAGRQAGRQRREARVGGETACACPLVSNSEVLKLRGIVIEREWA